MIREMAPNARKAVLKLGTHKESKFMFFILFINDSNLI